MSKPLGERAASVLPCSAIPGGGGLGLKQPGPTLETLLSLHGSGAGTQPLAECEYRFSRAGGRVQQRVSQGFANLCLRWWNTQGTHGQKRFALMQNRSHVLSSVSPPLPWSPLQPPLWLQNACPSPFSRLLFLAVVFRLQFANDHLGNLVKCRSLGFPHQLFEFSGSGVGPGKWHFHRTA